MTFATFLKSSSDRNQCPPELFPEIALIGRSNTGKSSLINFLVQNNNLAKTSSKPGKTRLINHFLIAQESIPTTLPKNPTQVDLEKIGQNRDCRYLVDLPGYGYAKVSKEARKQWGVMIEDYILNRSNLHQLFVLIDSSIPAQSMDIDFCLWLGTKNIPYSLIFTKTDKAKQTFVHSVITAIATEIANFGHPKPPVFQTSVKKGRGRQQVLDYIFSI